MKKKKEYKTKMMYGKRYKLPTSAMWEAYDEFYAAANKIPQRQLEIREKVRKAEDDIATAIIEFGNAMKILRRKLDELEAEKIRADNMQVGNFATEFADRFHENYSDFSWNERYLKSD